MEGVTLRKNKKTYKPRKISVSTFKLAKIDNLKGRLKIGYRNREIEIEGVQDPIMNLERKNGQHALI